METLQTIRPELLTLSTAELSGIMPLLWVFGGAIVAMVASIIRREDPKWLVFGITCATLIGAFFSSLGLMGTEATTAFNGMVAIDRFANFFNAVYLACGLVTVLTSLRYLDQDRLQYPEFNILVLFSVGGMMLMSASLDLIVFFIALELMSLAVYVLVGFRRADRRSNEAALKYFILGSAASAILLYGTSLLYGATGTINIRTLAASLASTPTIATPLFVMGAWLVVLGFLFKVATVPFHMWMPDVYEGAPTPVTGFMTTGLKAAAFASFLRVFVALGYGKGLSESVQGQIHNLLWVLAVLTMVVGNVIALNQTNLKRMLGYSSIAHTGYLLVGILCAPKSPQGLAPVVVYLVSYAVMNLGAFAILTVLSTRDDAGLNLHDWAGVSRKHPWLAFAMAVFLLSMAGIPPTAGFAAKYFLFYSAVQAGEVPLIVIAVLCSAVSVYYYLRVLVQMYMRDPASSQTGRGLSSAWASVSVAAMAALTLQVGLLPTQLMEAARRVVSSL